MVFTRPTGILIECNCSERDPGITVKSSVDSSAEQDASGKEKKNQTGNTVIPADRLFATS